MSLKPEIWASLQLMGHLACLQTFIYFTVCLFAMSYSSSLRVSALTSDHYNYSTFGDVLLLILVKASIAYRRLFVSPRLYPDR